MEPQLILVDEQDREIGQADKSTVHLRGLLHRAFSIFLFNGKGEMLLQRRAYDKYHSAGLWSNACCSHPVIGEHLEVAAQRRLKEELGITASLEKLFNFIYRAEFENELIEYEFDHVFVGIYEGNLQTDPTEIADHRYENMNSIQHSLIEDPGQYSIWFRLAFPQVMRWWQQKYSHEL